VIESTKPDLAQTSEFATPSYTKRYRQYCNRSTITRLGCVVCANITDDSPLQFLVAQKASKKFIRIVD
jgi:hypothetical protein